MGKKLLAVLTQRGLAEEGIASYNDMMGPLLILVVFALSFLLRGRIEFGNIYGFGLTGCIGLYGLINLMTRQDQYLELYSCISVLGYGFAPFCILAWVTIFVDFNNPIGYAVCALFVSWSTIAAARLFEYSLDMQEKRYLIAYPVVLFYAIFVQMTIL